VSKKKLQWVESGRGIAALSVVLYHCGNMMNLPQYSGAIGLNGFFRYGYLGVDFFFVLSGFIIYLVNSNMHGQTSEIPKYVVRRVARILPAYWVILVGGLIVNQTVQIDKVSITPSFLLSEFFLLNSGDLFIGPAWTLQNELLFYAVFASFFFTKRLGVVSLSTWLLLTITGRLLAPEILSTMNPWVSKALTPYAMHFLIGVVIGYWHIKQRSLKRLLIGLLVTMAAALLFKPEVHDNSLMSYFVSATSFGTILLVLLMLEAREIKSFKLLVWLGKVSYSLYLVHIFAIGYFFATLARLGVYQKIPEALLFFAITIISGMLAWCIYEMIEKPTIKIGQLLASKLNNNVLAPKSTV
jgi:exopolysaccharide production protein ExoZ